MITQQPTNIGPIPRVVKLNDSSITIVLFTILGVLALIRYLRK